MGPSKSSVVVVVPVAVVAVLKRPLTVLMVTLVNDVPPCLPVNVTLTFLTEKLPERERLIVPSL